MHPQAMGAPASLTKWIPEDDFLLKNAVEAGASLESLAKGAVCFSRRYSIQELQDRWYSLLYDLDTSSEASARIIEIEIELSVPNTVKANRTCNAKGKEYSFGKRKGHSVRSQYNAIRKRLCNQSCDFNNPSFLMPPSSCVGTGSYCGDQLKLKNEHQCNNFSVGAPTSNHYGHLETACDNAQHVFPEQPRVVSTIPSGHISLHLYEAGRASSVEGELADGIAGNNCVYGYSENISPLLADKTGGNTAEQSFGHDYIQKDFPQITEENIVSFKTCSAVQEIGPAQSFPGNDLYDNDNVEIKPLFDFDSANDRHERVFSSFVGNHNFTSQATECTGSFQQLGYSSPPHCLPIWKPGEDISAPNMPMDGPFEKQDQGVLTADDIKKMVPLGCDGTTSEPKLNDGMPENDFMDFPSPLIDYYMNIDEKDTDILLSSPSDTHQDDVHNSSDPTITEISNQCLVNPDGACSIEVCDHSDQMHSVHNNDPIVYISETDPLSTSKTCHMTEPPGEFIFCTLNSEDLEIPCNDDVFPLAQVLVSFPNSDLEQTSRENAGSVPSSIKILSSDQNASIRELSMAREEKVAVIQSHNSSLKAGSSILPKAGLVHSTDGCIMEADSDSVPGISKHAGIAIDNSHPHTSAIVSSQSTPVTALKEESQTSDFGKHASFDTFVGSFLEKPARQLDNATLYSLNIGDLSKQEADMQATKCVQSHAELVSADVGSSDPVGNASTSDQEEQSSDSENDVPNFSDIESMILDMDLGPYDEESRLFSKEVSKYHSVDAKKAIIRLEQGAHSYMNRAISSCGAFAIFYGRHLKCFIKTHEVSVGRGTDEVEVDIDLRREGPANKISRLQAFIKLDEDGAFFLRNVGKCSVFVNGKEIQPKKRTNLSSGSLIEIKDMRFIFEVNQNAVRRYTTKLRGSCQEQGKRFDWVPGSDP